jgi:hypothetical protein
MLARQINYALPYKRCKVVGKNSNDRSYFIEYVKDVYSKSVEYCWCRANQALKLGSEVNGYFCATDNFDNLPTLIVGECNSIIPSIKRIAMMSNNNQLEQM